jgi:hypothetical protein
MCGSIVINLIGYTKGYVDIRLIGEGYGVYHQFQQYFSHIVVVSFIGGGNRSTLRKPLTFLIFT